MAKIMSNELVNNIASRLTEAGILAPEQANNTRRIVIDLRVGHVPVMYTEMYGDGDVLSKLPETLEGIFTERTDDAS